MRTIVLPLAFAWLAAACGSGSSSTPGTTPPAAPDEAPVVPRPAPDASVEEPVTVAPDAAPAPTPPDPAQVKADLLARGW